MTVFAENAQLNSILTYLIDQWKQDGEMSKEEHRYYQKFIETKGIDAKKALWYELTGSEFEYEE